MNFAAEIFAGQSVAKLVGGRDQKYDGPDRGNRRPIPKPEDILFELIPVENDDAQRGEYGCGRQSHEIRREEKAHLAD